MTDVEREVVDLAGQVVVVTGGNGGIGLGMAGALAAAGADVAIWARNEDKNDAALERLRKQAPQRRFLAAVCDVADETQVEAALARTMGELGRVDALVANAGTASHADFLDVTLDEWRRVTSVNLDGAFLTLRAAARQMVQQGGGGALVAVSSTAAVHGAPRNAHYAASKSGLLGLVRSAAVSLARHGIRVNALVPGWTITEMTQGGYGNERFREATIGRTPVRRWAEPDDFGTVTAYLCDKRMTFHTGDVITVDGGYTIF